MDEPTEASRHEEEEHFTDEVIEEFFEEIKPIANVYLNKHGLDLILNFGVIAMLNRKLIEDLKADDDEGVAAALESLAMCYPHSPGCYIDMMDRLEAIWFQLFENNYIDYLYSEESNDDD